MAHRCPECDSLCFCGGDIDDLDFGESYCCVHPCQDVDDDWEDDFDFDEYDDGPDDDRTVIEPPPIEFETDSDDDGLPF